MKLTVKINDIIRESELSDEEVGKRIKLSPAKLSDLKHGRLGEFSPESLFSFLIALDRSIEIKVNKVEGSQPGIYVA